MTPRHLLWRLALATLSAGGPMAAACSPQEFTFEEPNVTPAGGGGVGGAGGASTSGPGGSGAAGAAGGTGAGAPFDPTLDDLWDGTARLAPGPTLVIPDALVGQLSSTFTHFGDRSWMFVASLGDAYALSSEDGDVWDFELGGQPVATGLRMPSVAATPREMTLLVGDGQDIYATSTQDGALWSPPSIALPGGGLWDLGVGFPALFIDDGGAQVVYTGNNGTGGTGSFAHGLATGADVGSLVKLGPPVMSGADLSWGDGVLGGELARVGAHYYLVFELGLGPSTCTAPTARRGWGLARSDDLVVWEQWPYNPVVVGAAGVCGDDEPTWQLEGTREFVVTSSSDGTTLARYEVVEALPSGTALSSYQAEDLSHDLGAQDGPAWQAVPGDPAGYLVFGPFVTDLEPGLADATFRMGGDGVAAADDIAVVDVYDTDQDSSRASVTLRGGDVPANGFTDVTLTFLVPPAPHRLEFRVRYLGQGTLRVDRVDVVAH